MIPTLKIGDFLFVNKMRYSIRMPFTEKELFRFDDPKRGDIVTFDPPNRNRPRHCLCQRDGRAHCDQGRWPRCGQRGHHCPESTAGRGRHHRHAAG